MPPPGPPLVYLLPLLGNVKLHPGGSILILLSLSVTVGQCVGGTDGGIRSVSNLPLLLPLVASLPSTTEGKVGPKERDGGAAGGQKVGPSLVLFCCHQGHLCFCLVHGNSPWAAAFCCHWSHCCHQGHLCFCLVHGNSAALNIKSCHRNNVNLALQAL